MTQRLFLDFWAGQGIDRGLAEWGIELEQRLPGLELLRRPSSAYAFALKWSGDIEEARPLYAQLRELGRSRGDLNLISILFYSVFCELISEDWEQANRFAEEGSVLAAEAERAVDLSQSIWAEAVVAAYRGREERTRSLLVEAEGVARAAGLTNPLLTGWAAGVLELALGKPVAAIAHLRPDTEGRRSSGITEPGLQLGLPEHIEAAIAIGELDEARELLDWFEAHALRLDRAWALACCARGRALLATATGEAAAAETYFADAYEHHARRPQQLPTYELARTLLAHGAHLRRRQHKRRARETLEEARAIFEQLGADAYAARARSELARIGGRALRAVGGELTETERQIADLVAQGCSNKQVAAALSLSAKTVEWNLSKVYAKLGVHSRTELASVLRR